MRFKELAYPTIFGAFFIAGLSMGFSYIPASSAPGFELETVQSVEAKNFLPREQINVLLIGVEHVGSEETRLMSMWLILIPPDGNELTFMPIYPQTASSADQIYASPHEPIWVDARTPESATNTRLLAEQGTWWDEVALLDEIGMALVLDMLGGIDSYREELSSMISEGAARAWENPQASLAAQTALLKRICDNSSSFGLLLSLGTFELPPSTHFLSSTNRVDLFIELYKLSSSINGFRCQFPTMD